MDYCEKMREMIGNAPIIIMRPSVAIINHSGEILLNRYIGGTWGIPGGIYTVAVGYLCTNFEGNLTPDAYFCTSYP